MSPQAVTDRLVLACQLSAQCLTQPRGVDMSPEAVTARLVEACSMSSLCLFLAHVGQVNGLGGPRREP